MKKIFMLAWANIRKTKGNTVSLLCMFFIGALLLNAGLLVFINFGGFFDKMTSELNTSNIYYILPSKLYTDEVKNYVKTNENVINMETEEAVWVYADTLYKGKTQKLLFILNDADSYGTMSNWKFVGEHLTPDANSVYLPGRYQQVSGINLGDPFEMTVDGETFNFIVKGFVEDVYFSSTETGLVGVYLPHDTFASVTGKIDDKYNATIIFANLKKINQDLETGIRDLTNTKSLSATMDLSDAMFSLDLGLVRLTRTMMASMVAVMVVVFSAIIAAVSLIVIRFRIGNSIEDDMTKIGSLKALGYTSRQIIMSIVMQFFMIALAGCLSGIAASYTLIPVLSDVFAEQSGIRWTQGFDPLISGICLGIVLLIVMLVALITSRRINKLHPIIALRGGLITHSFRRNHLPLHRSKGSLPFVLAIKSIIINLKQSIMMVIILIAVSFSGTFAVLMYYNTNVDTKAFLETPGMELSNVSMILNPDIDNSALIENIRNMDGVRKIQFIDQAGVNIGNNPVTAFVMEDYDTKETNTVYEGRYPRHHDEVAISGHISEMIGKTIGDTIKIRINNNEEEFLITGLTQGAYMAGVNIAMRYDSVLELNPDFKHQDLQVYLDKGVNTADFIKNLENLYSKTVFAITDMNKGMEEGAGVYVSIVSKVGYSMLFITVAVDILVLYFVINSSVIRRKRELGIEKAIGFTTFQIMNQLSLGFLIPVILGVFIGCTLGITQNNNIMSIVQRPMGIMKAGFIVTPLWVALFGVAIVIVSYITSMILTYRVRKVSAYSLVTE